MTSERIVGAIGTRTGQLALARAADERDDADATLTHLAAACALGGAACDWLALGERLEGETAERALANALDALDDPGSATGIPDGSMDEAGDDAGDDDSGEDEAEIALGVAERASTLRLREVAEDALGVALLEDPPDELRRRFLRAARAALDPDPNGGELTEIPKAGRNEPCPCGSGTKYKRCHGASSRPAQRARLSDDALLLAIAMPYAGSDSGPNVLDVVSRWVPRRGPVNVLAGTIAALRGERDEARRALRSAARAAANDVELHHDLLRALARIVTHDRGRVPGRRPADAQCVRRYVTKMVISPLWRGA